MAQEESGWKSREVAQHFTRIADALVPGRRETLSIIAGLVTAAADEPLHLLDLGCGFGAVTAEILNLRPDATACLVDFSDEMLRLSTERFAGNSAIKVIKHDLSLGLPNEVRDQKFTAAVSSHALHHTEPSCRTTLYAQIRDSLIENGIFVNCDRFREESPVIDDWGFRNWMKWTVKQLREHFGKEESLEEVAQGQRESDYEKGDKPGTIWEMERDLRQAGFRYVDCLWKQSVVAVVVASK